MNDWGSLGVVFTILTALIGVGITLTGVKRDRLGVTLIVSGVVGLLAVLGWLVWPRNRVLAVFLWLAVGAVLRWWSRSRLVQGLVATISVLGARVQAFNRWANQNPWEFTWAVLTIACLILGPFFWINGCQLRNLRREAKEASGPPSREVPMQSEKKSAPALLSGRQVEATSRGGEYVTATLEEILEPLQRMTSAEAMRAGEVYLGKRYQVAGIVDDLVVDNHPGNRTGILALQDPSPFSRLTVFVRGATLDSISHTRRGDWISLDGEIISVGKSDLTLDKVRVLEGPIRRESDASGHLGSWWPAIA